MVKAAHPNPLPSRERGPLSGYAKVSLRGNDGKATVYYRINWKRY